MESRHTTCRSRSKPQDELGGYYHRLGNEQRGKQMCDRENDQLSASCVTDRTANRDPSWGEEQKSGVIPSRQQDANHR